MKKLFPILLLFASCAHNPMAPSAVDHRSGIRCSGTWLYQVPCPNGDCDNETYWFKTSLASSINPLQPSDFSLDPPTAEVFYWQAKNIYYVRGFGTPENPVSYILTGNDGGSCAQLSFSLPVR